MAINRRIIAILLSEKTQPRGEDVSRGRCQNEEGWVMPRRRRSSRPITAATDEATNPTLGGAAAGGERKAFSASVLKQPGSILRKSHHLSRCQPERGLFSVTVHSFLPRNGTWLQLLDLPAGIGSKSGSVNFSLSKCTKGRGKNLLFAAGIEWVVHANNSVHGSPAGNRGQNGKTGHCSTGLFQHHFRA